MSFENLNSIIQQLSSSGEIKITDIPDIDLYMDQVTTLIDNKLGNEKRDKKDKLLTKTMINNYSKARILTPSKNKRYNKQQMIQLILIYYLKQVLSINDIHDLFRPLLVSESKNEGLTHDLYTIFLQIKKKSMENVTVILEEMTDLIDQATINKEEHLTQDIHMLLTVLMLAAQAQACKRTAEAIIDKYFKTDF
ncbi:MAG: hypothetical protein A2Y23_05905 [Clostridiales bacterium GWB2_37_7]|nr:MAG: hypothetical protein A2Y23_05905 [Clostridiales bacterium GWB2_37_7]